MAKFSMKGFLFVAALVPATFVAWKIYSKWNEIEHAVGLATTPASNNTNLPSTQPPSAPPATTTQPAPTQPAQQTVAQIAAQYPIFGFVVAKPGTTYEKVVVRGGETYRIRPVVVNARYKIIYNGTYLMEKLPLSDDPKVRAEQHRQEEIALSRVIDSENRVMGYISDVPTKMIYIRTLGPVPDNWYEIGVLKAAGN